MRRPAKLGILSDSRKDYMTLQTRIGYVALMVACVALVSCNRADPWMDAVNKSMEAFKKSIEATNRAALGNRKMVSEPSVSEGEVKDMFSDYREALSYAQKVDVGVLDFKYRGWGKHFGSEFRAGLESVLKSLDIDEVATTLRGHQLMDQWEKWFTANATKPPQLQ